MKFISLKARFFEPIFQRWDTAILGCRRAVIRDTGTCFRHPQRKQRIQRRNRLADPPQRIPDPSPQRRRKAA